MPPGFGRAIAVVVVAGALAECAPAATSAPQSTAAPPTTKPSPTAAALVADVDVRGGRTIHIVCAGPTDSGRPTVVFENGSGPPLSTWSAVMNDLTAADRACAYDRAGIGQSDGVPEPRTTRDQVADLAAVLPEVGVTGEIVLVGHSLGGWNAIVYTAEHPDQVVGAVLVDIAPPGLDRRWAAELPPETPNEPGHIREARASFTGFLNDPSMNADNLRITAARNRCSRLRASAPGRPRSCGRPSRR